MSMKNKKTKLRHACVLVVIAISSISFFISGCNREQKGNNPTSPTVQVAAVAQKNVPMYSEWIGTTDGMVNAVIRAQVQGYLIKQNYHEGDFVKKGQILFEIDPRTFQAVLDQAKGQLGEQKARWSTAKANLTRIIPLAEQNAVSKKDLDDATGQEQAAHAFCRGSG
jgi:membrane fusion protein (multidrug efflux system)